MDLPSHTVAQSNRLYFLLSLLQYLYKQNNDNKGLFVLSVLKLSFRKNLSCAGNVVHAAFIFERAIGEGGVGIAMLILSSEHTGKCSLLCKLESHVICSQFKRLRASYLGLQPVYETETLEIFYLSPLHDGRKI